MESKDLDDIKKALLGNETFNRALNDIFDSDNVFNDFCEDNLISFVIVAMLGKAAKCDGRVSEQEITYMDRLFEDWELDSTQRKLHIDVFNDAKKDKSCDIFYCARLIDNYLVRSDNDIEYRIKIYEILCGMMLADGQISAEEDKILRSVPQFLGLPDYFYFRFVKREWLTHATDFFR